jgi:hypothetical protein
MAKQYVHRYNARVALRLFEDRSVSFKLALKLIVSDIFKGKTSKRPEGE